MKILFMSDSLASPTGLTYVISSIMLQIKKNFPFAEIGYINNGGPDIVGLNSTFLGIEFCKAFENLKVFNCQIKTENFNNFNLAIEKFQPNIVFSLTDPWNVENVANSRYRMNYKWICYVPLETPEYPEFLMFPSKFNPALRKSIKELLGKADILIPVNKMGEQNLLNLGLNPVDPIFHGLDVSKIFTGKHNKREIFTTIVNDDEFIFMTMGKNTERKRIDLVIEAYNLFLKKIPNPEKYKLYIHSNFNDIEGPDIVNQLVKYKLEKFILLASCFIENKILSTDDLYKRYAVSDCYVGLPVAEGFGMGFAEAMLQGLPIIYSNYGGQTTYLDDTCGIGIPTKVNYYAKNSAIKWSIADVEIAAEAMKTLALNNELRVQMGKNAQKRAIELFDWNKIGKQLSKHFQTLDVPKNFSFLIEKHI